MGEAKKKLETLGPTRKLPLTRLDLVNLLGILMAPDENGKPLTFKSRQERRQAASALEQFGILERWQDTQEEMAEDPKKQFTIAELGKGLPEHQVKDVTVDAITWLTHTLDRPMAIRDTMSIAYFEKMLDDAIAGRLQMQAVSTEGEGDEEAEPEAPAQAPTPG